MNPLQTSFAETTTQKETSALYVYKLGEGNVSFTGEALKILRSFGSSDKWNKLERELPLKLAGTAVAIYKGELTGYVMANKAAKEELNKFGSHTVWEHFRCYVETAHLRDQSPAPGF